MEQKNNLPTLAELHGDPQKAFKNDQFKSLLNQPPHASWLKKHPMAKAKNAQGQTVPSEYMPIDKVEFMLDRIFQEWKIEVLAVSVLFQSIGVTVRLHYLNPVTGEWSFHDGVGAKSVQVNSGASAADLGQIKDAAVQMALPSAKSYAIKDAAEHLGSLFGRDLNRRDTVLFAGAYGEHEEAVPEVTPVVQVQAPQSGGWGQPQPNPYQQAPPAYQQPAQPTQPAYQQQAQPQSFNLNAL